MLHMGNLMALMRFILIFPDFTIIVVCASTVNYHHCGTHRKAVIRVIVDYDVDLGNSIFDLSCL
jgi:hypothetical protein